MDKLIAEHKMLQHTCYKMDCFDSNWFIVYRSLPQDQGSDSSGPRS